MPFLGFRERLTGLDIGEDAITAVRAEESADGVRVIEVGWHPVERDATADDTVSALKRLWRNHAFSGCTVSTCLRSRSVLLKSFSLPRLPDPEIQPALRTQAEETLQVPQTRIAMDWHTTAAPPSGDPAQGMEGILVAAPTDCLEEHLAILRRAGLYPVVVDAACTAIANAYLRLRGRPRAGEVAAVVSLSSRSADVVLLADGGRMHPRTIFCREENWQQNPDELAGALNDAFRFCSFRLRWPAVQKLVFTGRAAGEATALRPEGAREWLGWIQEKLGIPAEAWNPLREPAVSLGRRVRGLREEVGALVAASLGLALRND